MLSPEDQKTALPVVITIRCWNGFKDFHIEIGDRFAEYLKGVCDHWPLGGQLCTFWEENHWVGPYSNIIPKPYPNYTGTKFKYVSVFASSWAPRRYDYQPRRSARLWYEKGYLNLFYPTLYQSNFVNKPCNLVEKYERWRHFCCSHSADRRRHFRALTNNDLQSLEVSHLPSAYDQLTVILLIVARFRGGTPPTQTGINYSLPDNERRVFPEM